MSSALEPALESASCCGETSAPSPASASCCDSSAAEVKVDSRWMRIWRSTWKDFKQVFPYLMLGITLGAFIYGFMPADLIAQYLR